MRKRNISARSLQIMETFFPHQMHMKEPKHFTWKNKIVRATEGAHTEKVKAKHWDLIGMQDIYKT